jgi:hypothetical protein
MTMQAMMEPRNVEAIYPLSPIQHGILFHGIYRSEPGQYSSQLNCALEGDLDIAALEQVWKQLVQRHAIFRTAFLWVGLDDPVQLVLREVELPIEIHDLRGLDPLSQRQEIERSEEADRLRGFEFTQAPLMRLTLFLLDERTHRLLWSFHHLIMDGWSEALVTAELSRRYLALCAGATKVPELGTRRDYGAYLEWLSRQDLAQAEAFWRRTLAGFTAPTPLSPGPQAPREGGASGGAWRSLQTEFPVEATPLLKALARRNRLTLSILVQGAWSLLLSRLSGQLDVVFGVTVSGRPADLPGVEWIVGPFINTLPMRVRVAPEERLIPWLRQIQDQQVELHRYEFSPLVEVQRWSEVPRGQPLFENILVFQNGPAALGRGLDPQPVQGLAIGQLGFRGGWTNYPLSLEVDPERLQMTISFDGSRFRAATVTRMLRDLTVLLRAFVDRPAASVGNLLAAVEETDHSDETRHEEDLELAARHKLKQARRRRPVSGEEEVAS